MVIPTHVTSTNISCIGHAMGALYIKFNSGLSYSYPGVPVAVFEALKSAESVGRAFHQMIRGKFEYAQVEGDPFTKE